MHQSKTGSYKCIHHNADRPLQMPNRPPPSAQPCQSSDRFPGPACPRAGPAPAVTRPPAPARAKCRFTGIFDRRPDQFYRLLDRLSDHLALHGWEPTCMQMLQRWRLCAAVTCATSSFSEGKGRAPPTSHTEHALLVICAHGRPPTVRDGAADGWARVHEPRIAQLFGAWEAL